MNACIANNGGNGYKVAHMAKERLAREGRLPVSIRCDQFLAQTGGMQIIP